MNIICKEIAIELINFLTTFQDVNNLRNKLSNRGVIAQDSIVENGRSMELEVLEIDENEIRVVGFSDGLTGTVGVGATFNLSGVEIDFAPMLYVSGVPTDKIDIILNL